MAKEQVDLMNTDLVVDDPNNLSHTRIRNFFGCPARSGFEGLYKNFRLVSATYWQVGGIATHAVGTTILEKSVVKKELLPISRVDEEVEAGRKHIWMALKGYILPRGIKDIGRPSRLRTVIFPGFEDKRHSDPAAFEKKVTNKINKYLRSVTPSIRAIALRSTLPSPFRMTILEEGFQGSLKLRSPRNPNIKIPLWGEIDILEQHSCGGLIMTDWKTGDFSKLLPEWLEGNRQFLLYWCWVRQKFGVNPMVGYFVSLNVNSWDVEKYGATVFERQQYRKQANIRFEEHFPEFLREVDDVWAVLNFLAHPPSTEEGKRERDNWVPLSALGQQMGIKRNVEQNRLIPNIGDHCGICTSKHYCQTYNVKDWKEYEAKQGLANVVNPAPIPEEWLDPFPEIDEALLRKKPEKIEVSDGAQLSFFEKKPVVTKSPLHQYSLKGKEWKAFGAFTPKEVLARLRLMHARIPVINGEVCPCKRTDRLWDFFLEAFAKFDREREAYKCAQEAQGKKRSGTGDEKVKDLYDSEVLREVLEHCPIPDCPFTRNKNQSPQAK